MFGAPHVLAWEFQPPTPCRSCIAPALTACAPVWLLAQVHTLEAFLLRAC